MDDNINHRRHQQFSDCRLNKCALYNVIKCHLDVKLWCQNILKLQKSPTPCMRRPGIEPGSQEWESWMMTITLTAPSGLGHSLAL